MNRPGTPLFLQRSTYRRRRLLDGARLLPILGFVLILLPILWTRENDDSIAGEAIYFFALWAGLIAAAALLARPLRRAQALGDSDPPADAKAPATASAEPRDAAGDTVPHAPQPGQTRNGAA